MQKVSKLNGFVSINMERWYKQHPALIFFIGITASIVTYAYTNFSTKAEVTHQIQSVKDRQTLILESIDKRLNRIEDKLYK